MYFCIINFNNANCFGGQGRLYGRYRRDVPPIATARRSGLDELFIALVNNV